MSYTRSEPFELDSVDVEQSPRIKLASFRVDELPDFRDQYGGPTTWYIDVQLQMESGSRAPRRRYLLQEASNARLCPAGVVQIDEGPAKPFYSGRAMPTGLVDFGLIREWIEFYQEDHTFPNCPHNPDAGVVVTPRFRVINVPKRTVIMAPPAVRYLALSYIYGPSSVTEGL